jgi:hypothetical protein
MFHYGIELKSHGMTLQKTSTANLRIAITFVLMTLLLSPLASAIKRSEAPADICLEVSVSYDLTETCEQQDHETDCDDCQQLNCTHCALFGCGVCQLSLNNDKGIPYLSLSPAESNRPDLSNIWAFSKAPNGLFRPPRA